MGKKSIRAYLKSMGEYMAMLRCIARSCVERHPEMFVDVENTNSQVTGFTFSVSFDRDKDTGEIRLLNMDAWLGHLGKPHATLVMDYKGNVTLEERRWRKRMLKYVNPPKECDVCHKPIGNELYDAKTVYGPWATMCVGCFNTIGVGLGVGLGQMYRLKDGEYVKEAG